MRGIKIEGQRERREGGREEERRRERKSEREGERESDLNLREEAWGSNGGGIRLL